MSSENNPFYEEALDAQRLAADSFARNTARTATMTTTVTAEGYAYDPATRDWTKRVEYVARNRMEAIRWVNFNAHWMKRLRVIEL